MVQCPSLCLKFSTQEGKKISVAKIGNLLVALQDMAWQIGYYLENVPYREAGQHRKEILQKYDLLFRDIHRGSIEIDVIPSTEWKQATLLEEDATLPGHRAITKMTDFFEKIELSDEKAIEKLIDDQYYRIRLLTDALELMPEQEGETLQITGEARRKFLFKSEDRMKIMRIKETRAITIGAESRIGVLAELRVDGGKVIHIERSSEGRIKAEFPPDLENDMRRFLGSPVRAFGKAELDVKGEIKAFLVDKVEPLDSIEISPFDIEGLSFKPIRKVTASVDYVEGSWRLSIPGINATGYGSVYEKALSELREHISFLWDEYVICDESVLGETGILMRELLMKLFKAE